ncbi:MAG: hypothetical protein IPP79_04915 [Chitinophagaceae bacterium]|nr:hypothetical protein [Chitinophagaceae bacterium]
MLQIPIFEVLTKGTLNDFLNISILGISNLYGKPEDIEVCDSSKSIFYHYKDVRISFIEDISNEVVLYFYNRKNEYVFDFENESVRISDNYLINQMLSLLNKLNTEWKVVKDEFGPDYFSIKIHDCVNIMYDLESGKLDRISISSKKVV